jgi:hypothetical protein
LADELGNPVNPPNLDGSWNGGESVVAEMWVTSDAAFRIRSMQIDYRNSSPELVLGKDILNVNNDIEDPPGSFMYIPDGVPNFWFDYSRSRPNVGTYPAMGRDVNFESTTSDYIDFSNLIGGNPPAPFPPAAVWGLTGAHPTNMVEVAANTPFRLGGMPVTLPGATGRVETYTLDLLSGNADDVNAGVSLGFGFGTPTDPIQLWSTAVNDPTVDDSVAYAPGRAGPLTFVVVPEPATLAILALGGLAAALRRRKTA